MKIHRRLFLTGLVAGLYFLSACGTGLFAAPTPTPSVTPTPSPAPTPTQIVTAFDNLCSYVGQEVTITGVISVQTVVITGYPYYPLRFNPPGESDGIFAFVNIGDGPNQVKELQDQYSTFDLEIQTDDGKTAHHQDEVILTGKVVKGAEKEGYDPKYPCNLMVTKVMLAGGN